MGLDIPNSYMPLCSIALFCATLSALEYVVMRSDARFTARRVLKRFAALTGIFSLVVMLYALPHAFEPSAASTRFDHALFVEYRDALLPNLLIGVLLLGLVLTIATRIIILYRKQWLQEHRMPTE